MIVPRSAFLQLPAEIRIMIYKLLFTAKYWMNLSPEYPEMCPFCAPKVTKLAINCYAHRSHPKSCGQLLRVCQFVNQEATSILYENKAFYFKRENLDRTFSRMVGVYNAACIAVIRIGKGAFGQHDAMNVWPVMVKRLPSLKSFTFKPLLAPEAAQACHYEGCSRWAPCRYHSMQVRIFVLRFSQAVISTHERLKRLVDYHDGSLSECRLVTMEASTSRHVRPYRNDM